jgi:hypothetical protein
MIASFFEHLQGPLTEYLNHTQKQTLLQDHTDDLFFVTSLNFDPVEPLLNSLYSPIQRRPHRDPKAMLRSLLLMVHHNMVSVTDWVELTRKEPLIAILSGFDPNDTPGIGTYYDFLDRLVDGPYQKPCDHVVKPGALLPKKSLRSLKHESLKKKDLQHPNQPQSETLVNQLLPNSNQPRLNNSLKLLEDLFFELALIPSIQQGHLDLKELTVCGDGSVLESHASAYPKPICNCREKGIYRCDCPKPYRSATATWCHDHCKDTFIFGDKYYHLMTYQNGHDLPLLSFIPGGNESDYTLSLKTLDHFQKACKENGVDLKIVHFSGDGHHDAYAHYRYFKAKDIIPIIPLCESSQKALIQIQGIPIDDSGTPLCPAGARMRHHGYDKKDQIHLYACPAKRLTRRDGRYEYVFDPKRCPLQQDCAPHTPMGPWVRIPAKDNFRLFPPIPRSSDRFKLLYNQRSSTERKNNTNKHVYHLPKASRSAPLMQIRLILVDIVEHAKIWLRQAKKKLSGPELLRSCLDKLSLTGCGWPAGKATAPLTVNTS